MSEHTDAKDSVAKEPVAGDNAGQAACRNLRPLNANVSELLT